MKSLAILLAAAALPGATCAADARHPVVVELYQSQGCSSCPPALANVNALADRSDVLPLVFAVTYWDQLGWKDTFAQAAFTARQWDYARAAGRAQVATPQTIVNGAATINGGNRQELDRTIAAVRPSAGPTIAVTAGRIAIGPGQPGRPATVWLVAYDARTLAVPIRAGENNGKTLPHRNVVRSLTALGAWNGKAATYALPQYRAADPNRRLAVLVQGGNGGPILAASRV
jgi:hypothetical protein